MKILHTYCLNYNLGDYYLGIGLKKLLRNYLDVELIGETNIQGRVFNEYYINEVINKRYELLVIGGGGIIHGAHWPNGWFWLIEKDLIKYIKIPFIIYGVGYNYWEEEGGISQRGIDHLKETSKYSSYFSVRNDGSAARILAQTGISAPAIPDPGFHINLDTRYERPISEPYVLIQLANDKPENRFGSFNKKQIFINQMREIIKGLSKKYKVVFTPHVADDIEISEVLAEGIPNAVVWNFGYYAFDNSADSICFYEHAEFVIAMRGHGQIVPIAFNTPVIALENHPKHRGLMEELNLIEYNVKIDSIVFKEELQATIERLEDKRVELIIKYKDINKKLNESSKRAFDVIRQKING